jgi:hypothetical protein
MPTLERLEKGCKNRYAKAFNDIQARNEAFHFYTPKNKITIVGTCSKADAALNTTLIIIQHKKKYVTLMASFSSSRLIRLTSSFKRLATN